MGENNLQYFESPYDYLKWEYSRQKVKSPDLKNLDIDVLFDLIKNKYDDIEFYEKDKKLFEELKKLSTNLDKPVNEQNSSGYFLLNKHSEKIIKIANENNIYIPDEVILGTLPLNYLEAFTCRFPQGQRLIALSEGLFLFLYSIGRVVSSFFLKDSTAYENKKYVTFDLNKESIYKNLKTNTKGHEDFLQTLVAYFAYDNLSVLRTYYKEDTNINLSGLLWDTAELFIVAHEYSHIILGHLSEEKDFMKKFLDDDSMLYQIHKNWNEEFSADELAFQLTMGSNQDKGYGLFGCYLGIEFLFACLDILERVYDIKFSETHPSAKLRIDHLGKYLEHTLPQKSKNILEGTNIIQEVMAELWDVNKEKFYYIMQQIL